MKPLQILGKYELLEKIGSGGMAEVYKARQTGVEGFEKVVVVKKILPVYARNPSFVKMLVEEAKLSSVLQHPNIVQVIELDNVESQYYIVMEYVDGRDLLKILGRCAERKLPPSSTICAYVAAEVCKGLDYAHRARDIYGKPLNIIHRDISPSNIIVSWSGHVKVMDFGVAKAQTEDAKGGKHVLRGKLGYMSPEQVKGEEIDHRSDIFSLGIVLFESLILKRLFLGRTDLETLINIRDANIEKKFEKYPHIEPRLKDILRKALAADREMRYSSAMDFHNDLMEFLFEKKARVDSSVMEDFLKELFGEESEKSALFGVAQPSEPPDLTPEPTTPATLASRPMHTSRGIPNSAQSARPANGLTGAKVEANALEKSLADNKSMEPMPQLEVIEDAKQVPPISVISLSEPGAPFKHEESSPSFGQEPSPVPSSLKGHEFRLRNTQGYIFGPVTYENLVNLLSTGAVSEEEFISVDGADWIKVREVPAVRFLSPNEVLRREGVRPIYSGTVSCTSLIRIFHQIASRLLSGKLRVVMGSAQKEFYFRKGKPRHIASSLKQELLGPFLLRRGVLTEAQLKNALEKVSDFGGRLGDSLVSLGLVKPHELYYLLDQQFREKFLQIFAWTKGTFEFYEGVPCPIDVAPTNANVYCYVLDGIRKYVRTQHIEGLFKPHADSIVRPKKSNYLTIEKLPLNSREQRLWGQLQRLGSINTVIKETCNSPEQIETLYHLVVVLYHLELIEFTARE